LRGTDSVTAAAALPKMDEECTDRGGRGRDAPVRSSNPIATKMVHLTSALAGEWKTCGAEPAADDTQHETICRKSAPSRRFTVKLRPITGVRIFPLPDASPASLGRIW